MKHYGDITKLNGHELPVVDIITGGSPCQDLSVAGKREGLSGERSGLFMEQIRIIKEMHNECRKSGVDIRPRFMVWENVPGAFSSNKGEDFRAVLEETAKIADETAVIPRLAEKQKWSKSGAIMGDGWSIAWRVHDAQFWGVPQRRKRIALVADFRGGTAPEILFERKSVPGDSEPSREEGQGTATDAKRSINPSSYTPKIRGGREIDSSGKKAGKGALVQTELSATLGVSQDQTLITKCLNPWDVQSKHIQPENGIAEALYSGECRGGGGESYVMQKCYGISSYDSNAMKSPNPHSGVYEADTSRTLDNNGGNPACNQGGMAVVVDMGERKSQCGITEEISPTLATTHYGEPAVLAIDRTSINAGKNLDRDVMWDGKINSTLEATGPGAVCIECSGNRPSHCAVYDWHRCDTRMTELGETCTTMNANWGTGGNNVPYVLETKSSGFNGWQSVTSSMPIIDNGTPPIEATMPPYVYEDPQCVTYANEAYDKWSKSDKGSTLRASGGVYGGGSENLSTSNSVVRRLTPMECERLQGFPDHWTDIGDWIDSKGKKHKGEADSPRYKALGNSIALPFWQWMAERMCKYLDNPTMASLFDGIGGFPLVYSRCGCKPIWASEIEEFPIAVTKLRFGEEEENAGSN